MDHNKIIQELREQGATKITIEGDKVTAEFGPQHEPVVPYVPYYPTYPIKPFWEWQQPITWTSDGTSDVRVTLND
jgi:hypothetical protein